MRPLIENELACRVTVRMPITWEASGTLGITDRIEGQGRLMLSLSKWT